LLDSHLKIVEPRWQRFQRRIKLQCRFGSRVFSTQCLS
jgi:hypothetical protein